MRRTSTGILWIALYLAIVLAPLLVMVIRPTPPGRPFWVEFSLALGFVGLVQIALQFALIARFGVVSMPLGIDAILRYHRQIAVVAILFLIAHPVILVLHDPALVVLLDPIGGSLASRTGNWALYALVALALLSTLRRRIGLSYETWRVTHALLGIVALVLAHVHVHLAGRYTDAPWKEGILIAVSATTLAAFGYLRLVKPLLTRRAPYRVAEVRPERSRVWSLVLEPEGHAGLRFAPGQFAYLKLGPNPYGLDEHPFSFSSSASRPERLEFAIKELGDFTNRIGEVPHGTPAFLDGPHGSFSTDLVPAAGYVLIAGGIGIAPFMSVLRTFADRGDTRPLLLLYGERRIDDVAFREEIEALRARLRLDVVIALEEVPEGWEGERGFIDEAMLRRRLPREGIERDVLLCGPNPMIDAVEAALARCGVPRARIHAERFDLV